MSLRQVRLSEGERVRVPGEDRGSVGNAFAILLVLQAFVTYGNPQVGHTLACHPIYEKSGLK